MSVNSLHIDLPPDHGPSVIPWIVILSCAAVLLVLCSQLLSSIPASLQLQAQQRIDRIQYPDVAVAANGRTLELWGSININQSSRELVSQLESIKGVRQVHNALVVIDPSVLERQQAQRFSSSLAAIDVSNISFEPGSINFTAGSDSALSQLLSLMKESPSGRIRIEGHTDNTGPDTVNLRVSRERATAVANYLMARGIPADRLVVTGYGSTQPVAPNDTEAGRAQNRRIEINETN